MVLINGKIAKFSAVHLLWFFLFARCMTSAPLNPGPPSLVVNIGEMDDTPIFHVTFSNVTPMKVRFSKTFGFDEIFVNLELMRNGEPYRILGGEVFASHRFACLAPGDRITVPIDLGSLSHLLNGRVDGDPEVHRLPKGEYAVRARYWDSPRVGPTGCPSIDGIVYSEWLKFEVE